MPNLPRVSSFFIYIVRLAESVAFFLIILVILTKGVLLFVFTINALFESAWAVTTFTKSMQYAVVIYVGISVKDILFYQLPLASFLILFDYHLISTRYQMASLPYLEESELSFVECPQHSLYNLLTLATSLIGMCEIKALANKT